MRLAGDAQVVAARRRRARAVPARASGSACGTGQRTELSCARSIRSPSTAVAVGSAPAPLPNRLRSPDDAQRR